MLINIFKLKMRLLFSDFNLKIYIKYYFYDKNEYEIAKEEGTTHQAVNKSLKQAKEKLKEILKK